MTTTTAPQPITIVDRGLHVRLTDRDRTPALLWGPRPGTCACGQGCTGRESLTHAGIRSERDAHAVELATHGYTLQDGQAITEWDLVGSKVSKAEPRAKGGTPVPMDPEKKARQAEAMAYLNAYQGTWDFLLGLQADSKRQGGFRFRLTDRMVEVILASKAREERWAQERAQVAAVTGNTPGQVPALTTVDLRDLQAGSYAVTNGSGELTFLRVDRPTEGKWAGWVFVKHQVSDDLQRIGAQRAGEPSYRGQWPGLLAKVLADPKAAAQAYGQAIGSCASCHRTLTNAESREYGIGPECRGKYGA